MQIMSLLLPLLLLSVSTTAQTQQNISLPAPDTTGGKPLMQALKERQTIRSFSSDSLSLPVISNLLWAACGVNRPESGKRTAPSAMNWQEIDVYVAIHNGMYVYRPDRHMLEKLSDKDLRSLTGSQAFVADAPVNLIYVADYSRMGNATEDDKKTYSAADAAFISQNVYLFCASEQLATVVRGSVDREKLAEALHLSPEQHVVLAQTVGYPAKQE